MGTVDEIRSGATLRGGYYTISEATRLLRMDRSQRTTVKNWVLGNGSVPGPVIARQYPKSKSEVGFFDLIELRFIDYFRRQGVSLQSIRKSARAARTELNVLHPFARSNVKFVTDRKRIFSVIAEETGDKRLTELVTGQMAMYDIIEDFLAKGIEFDPDGLAQLWRPDEKKFPKITISPRYSHGHPIIDPAGVPTRTIFDLWVSEKRNTQAVADWFEIASSDIEQAVEYELDLAA